jgi:uncharacterized protein YodC (DUF2158 family)
MRSDVTELFEPGDLVQLKSGGPIMTVDKIVEDGPADLLRGGVFAIWFAYGKRHCCLFPPLSLQRAEARQPRPFRTRATAPALP